MNGFFQDIRLSTRALLKSPGTTIVAILALALGIGLLLAGSALLAGYIPARRASSIDPLAALREE